MREAAREIFRHALAEARSPRVLRGTCIASAECCASARIFTICIRIRACSSCRWARPDTPWSRPWPIRLEHRWKGSLPVRLSPRRRFMGSAIFAADILRRTRNRSRRRARCCERSQAQPASALVIFLLSGGGSSIVEKPIDDEISLDDLIATYRALVHSGAPIAEINAVRKHLSAVKGGRLALAASPAQQVSLLVSDVPDNTPDALASGPTMPDSTTVEDCYRIAEKYESAETVSAIDARTV